VIADRFGMSAAIWAVAFLTAASGVVVLIRMYETHQRRAAVTAAEPRRGVSPKGGFPPNGA
jgi:hypothetical protein